MPVDVGGWPVALTGWKDRLTVWAQEHGFEARHPTQERLGRPLLLLDAAHSLGATLGGQPVAPMSDIAVYSFHAVKNLTTAEGGAAAGPSAVPRGRRGPPDPAHPLSPRPEQGCRHKIQFLCGLAVCDHGRV